MGVVMSNLSWVSTPKRTTTTPTYPSSHRTLTIRSSGWPSSSCTPGGQSARTLSSAIMAVAPTGAPTLLVAAPPALRSLSDSVRLVSAAT